MANLNPVQELIAFAIERIERETIPTAQRIKLLRAASLCVVSQRDSLSFSSLADAIENTERQQKELFSHYSSKDPQVDGKDGHDHSG